MITLLTDFGLEDSFVGTLKGVIYRINPDVRIVDICHQVRPQDVGEAAFLLASSFKYFPPGTIHLIVVDPGVGSRRKIIIVKTKGFIFLAPDNGVLSYALKEEKVKKVIEVKESLYFLKPVSNTFQGRDIFAPVAAHLSKGISLEKFGKEVKNFKRIRLPRPNLGKKALKGEVIYIDHFGNLVTNITPSDLKFKSKKIKVTIAKGGINKISKSYLENKPGELLAIWGSFGFLEISEREGNAKKRLKIRGVGERVVVDVRGHSSK